MTLRSLGDSRLVLIGMYHREFESGSIHPIFKECKWTHLYADFPDLDSFTRMPISLIFGKISTKIGKFSQIWVNFSCTIYRSDDCRYYNIVRNISFLNYSKCQLNCKVNIHLLIFACVNFCTLPCDCKNLCVISIKKRNDRHSTFRIGNFTCM